jgi:hypothetical protein
MMAVVALAALTIWGCDGILLGPILFIRDVAPANQAWGVGLSLVLAPGILAGIVWPRAWSALLGVFAALTWLWLGALGLGINC